jgi:dUTPase
MAMLPGEWRWLASTRKLQVTAFGEDFTRMEEDGDYRADYALMNAYALVDEVSEAMAEIAWKPWAKDRGTVNRDAMVGELIDVAHFLANLLTMLRVTDLEWEEKYQEKQERNRQRQKTAGGYDTRQDKCPVCHREIDKPGAYLIDLPFIRCSGCRCALGVKSGAEPWEWYDSVIIRHAKLPGQ